MSAISNAKWVALSQFARIVSQLANIFLLARILNPSDYGLMAMATVVTNLALVLRDQGTSTALIQSKTLTHQTINTVYWLNVLIGMIIWLVMTIASPLIADYFKHNELRQILCLLAFIFPISSISISHQALLERASKFKQLAFVELSASILAMLIAIIAALQGCGVYSLVLQAILVSVLTTIQIYWISDWKPNGKPSFLAFKNIFPFTGHMTVFQLITYFFRNADGMVVGRILGAVSLGIYSMAYRVMLLPVQNITWAASRALLPVMSQQQDNQQEMRKLYLQTLGFISFLTAPLMAGIFSIREVFVAVAFGMKWEAISSLLAWLTLVGYLQSISSTAGTVFMAQGKSRLLMWVALCNAGIHVVAFVLGTQWGVTGVAQGYFFASLISGILTLVIASNLVGSRAKDMLLTCLPSITIACLMCMVIRWVYFNSAHAWSNHFVHLLLLSLLGVMLYLFAYIVLYKHTLLDYVEKVFNKQ